MRDARDNMIARLNQRGGSQQERMKKDKLKTMQKATLYSYQGDIAVLEDGREFRCLINKDKTKDDYDDKSISIAFEGPCENKVGRPVEKIGMKVGDTFEWKSTETHWIVYKRFLEEKAYFRAEIRNCDYQVEMPSGKKYWVYVRGPVETRINWRQKQNNTWNSMNHSTILMITKNEETLDFFDRFKRLEVGGKMWEVQTVDSISSPGVIQITMLETYSNKFEKEKQEEDPPKVDETKPYIMGPKKVEVYSINAYEVHNAKDGQWHLSNGKAKFFEKSLKTCQVQIVTGRSGKVTLSYQEDAGASPIYTFEIEIESV